MKFTTLGLNSSSNSSRTAPASEPRERTFPPPLSRPLGRGRDYRPDLVSASVFRAATRRVPPTEPEEFNLEMPPLARATTRRVLPPEPQEFNPEMPPLARATTRRVLPPEPDEFKPEMPPLARATTRRVLPPEPEEFKPEMPPRGLLGSLFSWLRGGAPARKQLRLVETVPLGEKRFVAIIHAQGRKYLVGGGTSGVALLTSLDEPVSHSDSIAPIAEPVEVAG